MTFRNVTVPLLSMTLTGLLMAGTSAVAGDQPGLAMAEAATSYLSSLSNEHRATTKFDFDDKERVNWHFIPRERLGLGLWDLDGKALTSAEALVATGLTVAGYQTSLEVRSLEEVLYLFESGDEAERRMKRHPHRYYISIFGDPSGDAVWGWRFEGHHLSLNYTVKGSEILSSTPEFFGANPGLIDAGPGRSLRVLGRREDLARAILKAASTGDKTKILLSAKAPKDIRGAGAAQPEVDEPEGLAFGRMNPEQQKLMKELIGEYLAAMPASIVAKRTKEIHDGGIDNVYFAWRGGSEINEPHHYVVQGPTFVIEYNNTQNQANHVHSIWRSLGGDFNIPR
ncbi:MAG: DUF3500 domain-containing protein [Fuerstiella sp.]|nr:DUF3500 domain-containing protein [Fuerstiella sp.]